MPEVSGERETVGAPERLAQIAADVSRQPALAGHQRDGAGLDRGATGQFPERYVYGTTAARIAAHLAAIRRLHAGEVRS